MGYFILTFVNVRKINIIGSAFPPFLLPVIWQSEDIKLRYLKKTVR